MINILVGLIFEAYGRIRSGAGEPPTLLEQVGEAVDTLKESFFCCSTPCRNHLGKWEVAIWLWVKKCKPSRERVYFSSRPQLKQATQRVPEGILVSINNGHVWLFGRRRRVSWTCAWAMEGKRACGEF